MKKYFVFLFPFLLVSCSEFSDMEKRVIQEGRLLNEAIAADFHDYLLDYWNDEVVPQIDQAIEGYSEEVENDVQNAYFWFGDNLLSNAAEAGGIEKLKGVERISDIIDESFDDIVDLISTSIKEKGLSATQADLDSIMVKIGQNDQEWYYTEDENSLAEKLGNIIAHPRYGFRPDMGYGFEVDHINWQYDFRQCVEKGSADDCIYCWLAIIQAWIAKESKEKVSVVYCGSYEDSLNSYVVGYSNHKAFLITFLRNDDESCSYEWLEVEYDTSNVGVNLLD